MAESKTDAPERVWISYPVEFKSLISKSGPAFDNDIEYVRASAPNTHQRAERAGGIYVASRASVPERGAMWRRLRQQGVPITSSWIDEDSEGATDNFSELWERITNEIARSSLLILYAEPDDFPLKGALIEAGIALGMNIPVVVCLPNVEVEPRSCRPIGSWINHPLVSRCDSLVDIIEFEKRYYANSKPAQVSSDGLE